MAKTAAAAAKAQKAMTGQGKSAVERACERAAASGLQIVGRGWRVSDGALAWAVPSQSEPGKVHYVVLVNDTLLCGCKGSAPAGRVCIHQGLVFNEMAAEAASYAAARRQAQVEAQAETPVSAASTAPVSASIGSARVLTPDEREQQRATAPLYRDNRPFSLFRQ